VFSKEGVESLGGFGTITSLFPGNFSWAAFWYLTAYISVILAFMNVLPIPALDGGHILFLLYEMITRKKLSQEFMIRMQKIGLFILLLLLLYANGMDIFRAFK
jgi:regulator of sigma E protease